MKERQRPSAFRLLGLARRAGAVAPGTDATRRSIRRGEARLVLVARDASSVQMDKVRKLMVKRPIPQAVLGDRATLGAAIGKGPTSAIAVTDESFAKLLLDYLEAASEVED